MYLVQSQWEVSFIVTNTPSRLENNEMKSPTETSLTSTDGVLLSTVVHATHVDVALERNYDVC